MAQRTTDRSDPYVGTNPIQLGQPIFGRDREVRVLTNRLLTRRIVLLHSPSGAGKTSLVNAGLLPAMKAQGLRVLPVIRMNRRLDSPTALEGIPAPNRYTLSALLSLEERDTPLESDQIDELATKSLSEYLDDRAIEDQEQGGLLLIFDQFEEILTLDPIDEDAKRAFFKELGEALRDRRRWALFVMRDDYVGSLDPYLQYIPTQLNSRVRLGLLRKEEACRAIQRPRKDDLADNDMWLDTCTEGAAVKLAENLAKVGPFVEPLHLQIVCKELWDGRPEGVNQIDESMIGAAAEEGYYGIVDTVLADYYARSVRQASVKEQVPEWRIRYWFGTELITDAKRRDQVIAGKEEEFGLTDGVIQQLIHTYYLVRTEPRRGIVWYELAHDRLIEPILQNNEEHLTLRQRLLRVWDRSPRLVVYMFVFAVCLAMVFLGLAVFAKIKSVQADSAAATAQSANTMEVMQRETAQSANTMEVAQRKTAQSANTMEVMQRAVAVEQRETAQSANTMEVMQRETAQSANTMEVMQRETAQSASTVAVEQRETAQSASTVAVEQRETAQSASTVAVEQQETAHAALASHLEALSKGTPTATAGPRTPTPTPDQAATATVQAIETQLVQVERTLTAEARPDLVVVSATVGANMDRYGCVTEPFPATLTTEVCVRNQGQSPAGRFVVQAGALRWQVPSLGPQDEICVEKEGSPSGQAVADADDRVGETNEYNNFLPLEPPPGCLPPPPDMVLVPADELSMGSKEEDIQYAVDLCRQYFGVVACSADNYDNEQPIHSVNISAFYIERTEVTQGQYAECVAAGACDRNDQCDWIGGIRVSTDLVSHPAVCVSWEDAHDYCQWRGRRLPTEAEWEYAARGKEGSRFPRRDGFDPTRANYCDVNCSSGPWQDTNQDDGYPTTAPVRTYDNESWCGAVDMAGNVYEWTSDLYGFYDGAEPSDEDKGERVLRGGSWSCDPNNLRSAARAHQPPTKTTNHIGFRCAKDAEAK